MLRGALVVGCALAMAVAFPGAVSLAHEGEEETSAKELVLQAIALLRGQPDQTQAIEDKLDDALEAEDKSGVDVALAEKGEEAFEAGQLHDARDLLEEAVGAAPHRVIVNPGKGVRSPAPPVPSIEVDPVLHEQEVAGGFEGPEGTAAPVLLGLAAISLALGLFIIRRVR